jgi:hypothetical protein
MVLTIAGMAGSNFLEAAELKSTAMRWLPSTSVFARTGCLVSKTT